MKNPFRFVAVFIVITILFLSLPGCAPSFPPPPANNVSTVQETEPNDSFSEAQPVSIPSGQSLQINGTFVGGNDLDVFDLGTFQAGQTITANLTGDSGVTPDNVQIGFFDQDQQVAILDDNAITADQQNIALVVRKPGKYFLALAEINRPAMVTYSYGVLVATGSDAVSSPAKQTVFLNFNGISSITVGSFSFNNILPFSALNNGMDTQVIAAQTTDAIRAHYAPYNIQILSSNDSPEPADPHSSVFISASINLTFYGMSSGIDWYNQNPSDTAVIFAGSLAVSNLSQEEFITALANVAAHEMGHLSGLAHTRDHTELMDQVTPLNFLDQTQDFHLAPLAEFPTGVENTPQLLQSALGLLP